MSVACHRAYVLVVALLGIASLQTPAAMKVGKGLSDKICNLKCNPNNDFCLSESDIKEIYKGKFKSKEEVKKMRQRFNQTPSRKKRFTKRSVGDPDEDLCCQTECKSGSGKCMGQTKIEDLLTFNEIEGTLEFRSFEFGAYCSCRNVEP